MGGQGGRREGREGEREERGRRAAQEGGHLKGDVERPVLQSCAGDERVPKLGGEGFIVTEGE